MVEHSVEEIPPNDFAMDTVSTQEQQEASTETKKNSLTQQLPSRQGRKRERSPETTSVDVDHGDKPSKKKKQRLSRSLSRFSRSVQQPLHVVVPGEGFRDSAQKMKAIKLAKKASKKRNKAARRGEADRVIVNLKPKHTLAGKRSKGKAHHRWWNNR